MKPPELSDELLQEIFRFLLMPRQVFKLRSVCKHWRALVADLLDKVPFLLLDTCVLKIAERRVVMGMAPVNSSGDMYHMLAFVILSLHQRAQIAPLLLTYDVAAPKTHHATQSETTTGLQVQRSQKFVAALGYEDCFFPKAIASSSGQPAPRQAALEDKLKALDVTHYIDHRFSTAAIAEHFRQLGFEATTAILRQGFRQRNFSRLPKGSAQRVDTYVAQKMKAISAVASNGLPTVIIHYRISGKSNSDQDLGTLVKPTITALKTKRYNIVVIHVDSRLTGYGASTITQADLNLRPFQEAGLSNTQEDLGKLAHLGLLLALYDQKERLRLQGIIGNTSGTLDLAALMGHRVFNIHAFGTPNFDYQDYRVLLQMCFFSVARSDTDRDSKLLNDIETWLQAKTPIAQMAQHLSIVPPKSFGGLGKKGFALFTSVMDVARQTWTQQAFFQALCAHVNAQCKAANFLTEDYTPPKPS